MANVFFSYCHADEGLRDQLQKHLTLMKREGLIQFWHDRRIDAGSEFDGAIREHLEQADVILLLISADFMASEYCFSIEMTRAMERHQEQSARVIPVILRPCDWHSAPFGKLVAAPRDGKAVTLWPNADEAMLDVAQKVRAALTQMKGAAAASTARAPRTAAAAASPLPRSSNMSVRKRFTDLDKDQFEQATFDYIARFFEGSLRELEDRHADQKIRTRFTRIDARHLCGYIYQDGESVSECSIRMGGAFGGKGITYSSDASARSNSFNGVLSIEADDQMLFLVSMFGGRFGGGGTDRLTEQGAAEHFWEQLIEPLQR